MANQSHNVSGNSEDREENHDSSCYLQLYLSTFSILQITHNPQGAKSSSSSGSSARNRQQRKWRTAIAISTRDFLQLSLVVRIPGILHHGLHFFSDFFTLLAHLPHVLLSRIDNDCAPVVVQNLESSLVWRTVGKAKLAILEILKLKHQYPAPAFPEHVGNPRLSSPHAT